VDLYWVRDFNFRAKASPSGFKARLATRFQTGDAQLNAMLNDLPKPSDAYIVFRLGEISGQPLDRVMAEHEFSTKKGWCVIAKRPGIKPGSKEFRAMKAGRELYAGDAPRKGKETVKKECHNPHPAPSGVLSRSPASTEAASRR
jgi:hypothetical protein